MKKNINHLALALAFAVVLFACKKYEPLPFNNKDGLTGNPGIYMPQSAVSSNFIKVSVFRKFAGQADSIYKAYFNAYLSGYVAAASGIAVTFEVDVVKLDSLNALELAAGRPPYELLPDSVYTISGLNGTIPANERGSELQTISIHDTRIQDNHKYILPITLKSASGGSINSKLATTFYTFSIVCRPVYSQSMFQGDFIVVKDDWSDYSPGQICTLTTVGPNQFSFKYVESGAKPIVVTVNTTTFETSVARQVYTSDNGYGAGYGPISCESVSGNAANYVSPCDGTFSIRLKHTANNGAANFGEATIVLKRQ